MRKISVLLLFVAFLGCAKEKQQPSKPIDPKRKQLAEAVATNPDSSLDLKEKARLENLRIEIGEAISFPCTKNIAIPLLLEENFIDKELYQSFFNIAILRPGEELADLLFDESVFVENIETYGAQTEGMSTWSNFQTYGIEHFKEEAENYEWKWPAEFEGLIFFELYRFKGKERDYKRLLCYDLKNDALRQLSPENAHVVNHRFFKGSSQVLITSRLDSDHNGKFENLDDQNISLVDFRRPEVPSSLLLPLDSLRKFKLGIWRE
jgi:hypothetical protein